MNEQTARIDIQIATAAFADETAAFESLFRHFHPRLVRFLAKLLEGSSVDPEDVAQESMVKAWAKRDQFDPKYQFSTWAYTIARRTAADHLRNQPPAVTQTHLDEVEVSGDAAEDLIESRETAANLWHVAQRVLSSSQYAALWLRYGEDMTVKEISRILEKSSVSTRVLLHRARTTLGPHLNSKPVGTDSRGGDIQ